MLTDLAVEGLGVIERAEISLAPGCSALTGETGAGKTLLVAALGLLLGGRADRALVRQGHAEARVEGRFVVPRSHPGLELLTAEGVVEEPAGGAAEVVVARTLSADGGSSKARVNGRLVRVGLLEEVGSTLIEIAGQHSSQQLGAPGFQRSLLDAFAGRDAQRLAREVESAVRLGARAERVVEDLRGGERDRIRELDLLRHETSEIEAAGLQQGESERLGNEALRLEHAESIALALGRAGEALRGEGGVEDLLAGARKDLDDAAGKDPELGDLSERLESAALELADLAEEITRRVVAPDPAALEAIRERLGAISRLRRKYGDDESEILGYLAAARRRAGELETAAGDLERWEAELEAHRGRAQALASELSRLRRGAASRLERAVEALLEELALPRSSFRASLSPRPLYEGGNEQVEFLIATNPGEAPRPLAKVASGGELARVALALHLLTTTGQITTMVFDEVDAGVGGEAAQAVGRSLARLAHGSGAQVVVVTHLPQVAAFADAHYRISKAHRDGRTSAVVERVEGEARIAELSRMLAGLPESERAKQHAAELLELASQGASSS